MAIAHTQALKEDAALTTLRNYADDHRELLDAFILAVATDPALAMDLAASATRIIRARERRQAATHLVPSNTLS